MLSSVESPAVVGLDGVCSGAEELFFILGPCVIESEEITLLVARKWPE